jgi:hypothetical protein
MDANSALSGGGIVGGIIFFVGIVYKAVNHHRIRSKCCGKEIVASVDIEETTPPNKELKIKVPEAV